MNKESPNFLHGLDRELLVKKCTRHSRPTVHKAMQPSDYNCQIDNGTNRKCHFEHKEWQQDGELFQFALLI